ncbi:MAG: DMT family transporter [Burkholderiales bacterium]|nr:DMT family transporter [Burkholderiales bacterium]
MSAAPSHAERNGLLLGLVGVVIFSATLPATRIAVLHLDPIFVGLGRSLVAAVPAALFLLAIRAPWPSRRQALRLLTVAFGVVLGFPALTSLAMRHVPSAHGAIVVGLLPLFTAIMGAWLNRERPSVGFWITAVTGSTLVVTFAIFNGGGALHLADLALFVAVVVGAFGYAEGARLTRELGGRETISWAILASSPFLVWPVIGGVARSDFASAGWPQWAGFFYVAIFSQFLGFFAWYKGLDLGGVARVSQVQLSQVFFTMLIAAWLLGEKVTPLMIVFAVAVVATVAIGRRMPVKRA